MFVIVEDLQDGITVDCCTNPRYIYADSVIFKCNICDLLIKRSTTALKHVSVYISVILYKKLNASVL